MSSSILLWSEPRVTLNSFTLFVQSLNARENVFATFATKETKQTETPQVSPVKLPELLHAFLSQNIQVFISSPSPSETAKPKTKKKKLNKSASLPEVIASRKAFDPLIKWMKSKQTSPISLSQFQTLLEKANKEKEDIQGAVHNPQSSILGISQIKESLHVTHPSVMRLSKKGMVTGNPQENDELGTTTRHGHIPSQSVVFKEDEGIERERETYGGDDEDDEKKSVEGSGLDNASRFAVEDMDIEEKSITDYQITVESIKIVPKLSRTPIQVLSLWEASINLGNEKAWKECFGVSNEPLLWKKDGVKFDKLTVSNKVIKGNEVILEFNCRNSKEKEIKKEKGCGIFDVLKKYFGKGKGKRKGERLSNI